MVCFSLHNIDFLQCFPVEFKRDATFSDANFMLLGSSPFVVPMTLDGSGGTPDRITATVQDNLTGLNFFYMSAKYWRVV